MNWVPFAWVAALGVILIVAYELYAAWKRGLTESQMIWHVTGVYVTCPNCQTTFRPPLVFGVAIAFGFGCLMGHFFL